MSKVVPRPENGAKSAPAAKKASTKKGTKKAPPAAKASGSTVDRKVSTISKDGTAVDEFDGKEYPVTRFPTVRQKDGTYVRGTVTRANLPAWREQKRKERDTAKATKAAAKKAPAKKAAPAAKKAAAKPAAKTEEAPAAAEEVDA